MINFAWEEKVESIVNTRIISSLRKYDKVIIFGAGESGSWAVKLLRENAIYPVCFCDNYPGKWGKVKDGIKIESFETSITSYKDAAICIASMWSEEIINQIKEFDSKLLQRTWDLLTTMAWETSNKSYVSNECNFITNNIQKFESLYSFVADDYSRRTLTGILNYRLTRNKKFLSEIKSSENIYLDRSIISPEYWNKITEGSIIDGGAFDGDTVDYFMRAFGKESDLDIHCYEAESDNCQRIKERLDDGDLCRITIHQNALWNSGGEIFNFEGNGLSGRICQKPGWGGELQRR